MKSDSTGRAQWIAMWCAAWFVFAVVYAMLMYAQSSGMMGLFLSLRIALLTMLAPAVMSVGVWRLTGQYARRRPVVVFVSVHAGVGLLFAGIWAGWIVAVARVGSGPRVPASNMVHTALPWQAVLGLLVYTVVATSSYMLRSMVHARNMELAAEHADRLRAQAHLAALRAHIDPHFLFNTLHSVSELLTSDPVAARHALEQLSDMFRYTLRLDRQRVDLVTVEDEWKVVQSYLSLESLRLGSRLRIATTLDDEALACALPPFTLQPIVENAVRHGVSPNPSGGTLTIRLLESDGSVVIAVSDDGVGCDVTRALTSSGLGLRSVRERLNAHYGAAASVQVHSRVGEGTTVTLRFPASVSVSSRGMSKAYKTMRMP
jgi:signal transduction histidine kinase